VWNLFHTIEEILPNKNPQKPFFHTKMNYYKWHENVSFHGKSNFITMGNLLYIIAVILLIGWALGFFVYSAGSIIHLLLVIAVIAVIFRVIRGERI